MPKVTVLMSVYNGERFLCKAIESILGQTWKDFEFLIINDRSTDNSKNIVLSFNDSRIRFLENSSRKGLTKSLNRGLQLSHGELVARQDADDVSHPTRLARQILFLESHPEVVLLGSSARAIDDCSELKNVDLKMPTGLAAIRWYLMFHNAFIHSSVMFRRNIIINNLDGYNESFKRAQDYELWSRLARDFVVENLSDILLDHRYEYGSITSLMPLPSAAIEKVILNNLRVFLKDPAIPAECAQFIMRFRRLDKFSRDTDWKHIAEIYQQTYEKYCLLYPEAESDQTIRSHLAGILYWIAYYAASGNRRVSFQTYVRAKKLAPKINRHPCLARYMALWIGGEGARCAYYRFGQRNRVDRNLQISRDEEKPY